MDVIPLTLPEVKLIRPKRHGDHRGFFSEVWSRRDLANAGLDLDFVQDNHSMSAEAGTVRALHFQTPPFAQDKLVRVARGRILDVAVDVRRGSPSFGEWVGAVLDDVAHHQLWIPPGFAHGFLVLSELADFCYLCSDYYHPASEQGIAWDDPDLAIGWPDLPDGAEPQLSAKDRANPTLAAQDPQRLPR